MADIGQYPLKARLPATGWEVHGNAANSLALGPASISDEPSNRAPGTKGDERPNGLGRIEATRPPWAGPEMQLLGLCDLAEKIAVNPICTN